MGPFLISYQNFDTSFRHDKFSFLIKMFHEKTSRDFRKNTKFIKKCFGVQFAFKLIKVSFGFTQFGVNYHSDETIVKSFLKGCNDSYFTIVTNLWSTIITKSS